MQIINIELGKPLILGYPNDANKILKTSPVEAFSVNDNGMLQNPVVIQTRNSVYVLRKVKEAV